MHRSTEIGVLLCGLIFSASVDAAPPKGKPSQNPVKAVDADNLPAGQFIGTIVSPPDSDRMFTLKITYPEVRLKAGTKTPNLRNTHTQNMHRSYQQLIHLQQQLNRSVHHHVIHNMMQMQQAFLQMEMNQQRATQSVARIQQKQLQHELKLLQQEIQAIKNMYQVVKVTRNFVFQAAENVKVRTKKLPELFDEKGNVKKYTHQELAELKGKDKNLEGYESSVEALKPGQVVQMTLRAYRKPTPTAAHNDKNDNKEEKDANSSIEHKMQVKVIVILPDNNSSPSSTTPTKNKK